jgi:hypothetical protein
MRSHQSSTASEYISMRNEEEVLKSGLLNKRAVTGRLGFNWRRRVLTVHPARITWRKQNSTKILGEFVFGLDTHVRISRFKPHSFCIASFEKELHLQCENDDEVKEWIDCIKLKTDVRNITLRGLQSSGIIRHGSLTDNDFDTETPPTNDQDQDDMRTITTAEQKHWISTHTINISQLKIGPKIGAGASGQVHGKIRALC